MYFSDMGLVTSRYKEKEHYIPWDYIDAAHQQLSAGLPYNAVRVGDWHSDPIEYPLNQAEAAFILENYIPKQGRVYKQLPKAIEYRRFPRR